MSKVRLYGDTSGFVDLKAPDVAGDVTITLPNTTGPFATETYVDAAVAGIAGIGSNVVQTVKTDTFSTTSSTFTDVTGLTATITPTSATSKVLVIVQLTWGVSSGDVHTGHFRLFGGNADDYVGNAGGSRVRAISGIWNDTRASAGVNYYRAWTAEAETVVYLDSPATTSATTYSGQVRIGGSGTVYVNRSGRDVDEVHFTRGASSITVVEVAA